ncbi:hypothetical protein ACWGKK_28385, partial [Streptomyces chartreusis]
MAAGLFEGQYVWHPAADDRVLASVCVDVRAGRYLSSRDALAETRGDFALRAHRSLVLASEAADSDLVERWLTEEPGPEAALMWARVAVLRALRAADARDPRTEALERIALAACERATTGDPRQSHMVRRTYSRPPVHRDAAVRWMTVSAAYRDQLRT